MKPNIHPEYVESQIVCACGAVYHTRSTKQNLRLGICAACHPFFTGQQKFIDTAGRVEKFTQPLRCFQEHGGAHGRLPAKKK